MSYDLLTVSSAAQPQFKRVIAALGLAMRADLSTPIGPLTPQLLWGTGVPAVAAPNGSVAFRLDGALPGEVIYFRQGAAWVAADLASSGAGAIADTNNAYAIDTIDAALDALGLSRTFISKVTISAAAVATLNATPVEVVPAPGAGLYVQVESIHAMLDFNTAAYDGNAAGEDLSFKYTNAAGNQVAPPIDESGFADAVADDHKLTQGQPVNPVVNAPIVAHVLNGEWFGAAGDSPVHVEVVYRKRVFDIS